MYEATRSTSTPRAVDNTDWLKTAAIILVAVDHFGYFFIDDARWWSVFGRLAAPTFFFLLGYAHTRTVPMRWIWLGVILTLLESSNANWTWVAPNILFSFALIRIARPYVQILMVRYHWFAFALIVSALLALLPIAAKMVDYGAEGWLWALFGLFQRMHVDGRSAASADSVTQSSAPPARTFTENGDLMRLLACLIAAMVYVWQEQREYAFSQPYFAVFILGVAVLATILYLFERRPSLMQPPEPYSQLLRFIGRHTLEIYAIQLAGSELIVKLLPGLAP